MNEDGNNISPSCKSEDQAPPPGYDEGSKSITVIMYAIDLFSFFFIATKDIEYVKFVIPFKNMLCLQVLRNDPHIDDYFRKLIDEYPQIRIYKNQHVALVFEIPKQFRKEVDGKCKDFVSNIHFDSIKISDNLIKRWSGKMPVDTDLFQQFETIESVEYEFDYPHKVNLASVDPEALKLAKKELTSFYEAGYSKKTDVSFVKKPGYVVHLEKNELKLLDGILSTQLRNTMRKLDKKTKFLQKGENYQLRIIGSDQLKSAGKTVEKFISRSIKTETFRFKSKKAVYIINRIPLFFEHTYSNRKKYSIYFEKLDPNKLKFINKDKDNVNISLKLCSLNDLEKNAVIIPVIFTDIEKDFGHDPALLNDSNSGKYSNGQIFEKSGDRGNYQTYFKLILPKFTKNDSENENKLTKLFKNCLKQADKNNMNSIVLPILPTGDCKLGPSGFLRAMVKAVAKICKKEFENYTLKDITICCPDGSIILELLEEFKMLLREYTPNLPVTDCPYEADEFFEEPCYDITEQPIEDQVADVFIIPTQTNLTKSAYPISKGVFKKGGEGLVAECNQRYPKGIKSGEYVKTAGHGLSCDSIFHAALPKSKLNFTVSLIRFLL